ncbi:MAG: hypothetical protein ACXAD7_23805 [Candidatus Kariarchaeaceae archaeon]|jgi:hypothetical protein
MRRKVICIVIVLALIASAQLSLRTTSFYGFGDYQSCNFCHNNVNIAWNASYANTRITLDGLNTEPFWNEDLDIPRKSYIYVASAFEPELTSENIVYLQIAQNSTYIFALIRMGDGTINGSNSLTGDTDFDGFAIIWDISMADFGPEPLVDEVNNVGENVDLWLWTPHTSSSDTQDLTQNTPIPIQSNVWDASITSSGVLNDPSSDLSAEATHGNVSQPYYPKDYQIEFARELYTDDPDDIQFTYSGYYNFALAWSNNTGDYMVSYKQTVWIYGAQGDLSPTTVTQTENITATEEVTVTLESVTTTVTKTVSSELISTYVETDTITEDAEVDLLVNQFSWFVLAFLPLLVIRIRSKNTDQE